MPNYFIAPYMSFLEIYQDSYSVIETDWAGEGQIIWETYNRPIFKYNKGSWSILDDFNVTFLLIFSGSR